VAGLFSKKKSKENPARYIELVLSKHKNEFIGFVCLEGMKML
jgi:hypothetical protein